MTWSLPVSLWHGHIAYHYAVIPGGLNHVIVIHSRYDSPYHYAVVHVEYHYGVVEHTYHYGVIDPPPQYQGIVIRLGNMRTMA